MSPARRPVVLDLDGSVGPLPGELRLPLAQDQEALRFGCRVATLRRCWQAVEPALPAAHGTVFLGSGDFHHLSWPLIERAAGARTRRRLRVVVLDNHPDNMRFPFGVHCGSWVRRVAALPGVAQVHVVGITSGDIGLGHAWENHIGPLRSGKLIYWSTGVDVRWARWLGLGQALRSFGSVEALTAAACEAFGRDPQDTYLSIDKDVFSTEVVQTNWDQGRMRAADAAALAAALAGHLVGSDVTGEISSHRYATRWKRWLTAHDGQAPVVAPQVLAPAQAGQARLNAQLLAWMGQAGKMTGDRRGTE